MARGGGGSGKPTGRLDHGSSLLAGALGALGSVLGKLGFDPDALARLLPASVPAAPTLLLALRALCVALMLACNAAMAACFVRALHASGSSLAATVISSALNFVLTGVAGRLLFAEALSLRWWAGAGLTLLGVTLVAGWGAEEEKEKKAGAPGGGRYELRQRRRTIGAKAE